MQTFNVIEYGVARPNRVIARSVNISNGELIQRVPKYLPKESCDDDDGQSQCDVADELTQGD